jgi:hypothetical protein
MKVGAVLDRHGERAALVLCALAFLARAAFLLLAAQAYFGRANVYVDGDTGAWTAAFLNWWERGVYTANPGHPSGAFGRMPGYSFVIGAFYLATGGRLDRAYPALAWFQILADSGCVFLLFRIGRAVYAETRPALALAALYAFYPFAIVWTPVAYSEILAIDLMIAGVLFFVRSDRPLSSAASGALIGLSVLFRPQMMILGALMAVRLALSRGSDGWRRAGAFAAGFLLLYAPWPIRNYVGHGRLVLAQDISGFKNWAPDVMGFMQYMFSVKAEWEPQFTQMVTNQLVVFPEASYAVPGDREKLQSAVRLAQTCGSGFTNWKQSVRPPLVGPNCDAEVARLFGELRESQYRNNRWNAYVKVPLQNLGKAVFKRSLNDTGSAARRLASSLFLYRTALILVGIAAGVVLLRRRADPTGIAWVALAYGAAWYVLLCAGTLPQLRNIEMRYFLPCDVLLLVPAAWALGRIGQPSTRQTASTDLPAR